MSFRWVEHTGELELEIVASSEASVFEEALAAFAELIAEHSDDQRRGGSAEPTEAVTRQIDLQAPDRGALLAAWLDELIYLAETERLVPVDAPQLEVAEVRCGATGVCLRASVRMMQARPPDLVKGATFHRLAVVHTDSGWRANVVLDV